MSSILLLFHPHQHQAEIKKAGDGAGGSEPTCAVFWQSFLNGQRGVFSLGVDHGRQQVSDCNQRLRIANAARSSPFYSLGMRGRVRSRHHNDGSAMAAALNPSHNVRDLQVKRGEVPTDFARRNLARIRETQKRVQERREASLQAASQKPKPFKLKQFEQVAPRVKAVPDSRAEDGGKQESPQKNFLKKGQGCTSVHVEIKSPSPGNNQESARSTRSRPKMKSPVPKANELNSLAPRSNRNFIQENAREAPFADMDLRAREEQRKKDERKAEAASKHSDFGKVPNYLLERQTQLMQEKQRKLEAEDRDCPPGMVRLPDDERLRTLAALRESKKATELELQKLPLNPNSVAQRRRKEALERDLEEQETAIDIFSKEKVFVQEE